MSEDYNYYYTLVSSQEKNLGIVPDEYIDKKMCLVSLWKDTFYRGRIPKSIMDKEIALKIIENTTDGGLHNFPKNIIDKEVALAAIRKNAYRGHNPFQYLPDSVIDTELVREVVKHKPYSLEYVPLEFIDRELCMEAVKIAGCVLGYVPDEFRDEEICAEACKNGTAFECVPEKYRTKQRCLQAVKHRGLNMVKFIPEHLLDDIDICREIIFQVVHDSEELSESVSSEFRDKLLKICESKLKI